MKLVTITAESTAEALARVHAELGPEAVVVNVRRLPVHGLARLWQRQGPIEVVAFAPDRGERPWQAVAGQPGAYVPFEEPTPPRAAAMPGRRSRRSLAWLESLGTLRE